jgi:hypothetical protein
MPIKLKLQGLALKAEDIFDRYARFNWLFLL